ITLFSINNVMVNGILQEGADPELGFPLNDLPTGANVIVSFEVLIDEIPQGNNVVNNANVGKSFNGNPSSGSAPSCKIPLTIT
ncbi:hypothetical protein ACT453_55365, partial [Bacillus sp. D-CC]